MTFETAGPAGRARAGAAGQTVVVIGMAHRDSTHRPGYRSIP
ncbi:MAG TPA: hypothetical protein VII16_02545 [Actinomycetes bacterium]